MAIRFQCASCSQPIEVDDEWALKTVACPYCRRTVVAPAESSLVELTEIPLAAPVSTSAPGRPAEASNRLAVAAFVLACLQLSLLVIAQMITSANWLEFEEFSKVIANKPLDEMARAQGEFFRQRGGFPPWMAAVLVTELLGGLAWLGTVICGGLAVRRAARRGFAVIALLISLLLPLIFCVGVVRLGGAG